MNLFGKAKTKSKANTGTSASIAKLKETLESLDKRENYIQKKIRDQLLEAKAKSKAKDKKGAMFALKRKKMLEGEANKLNGARMTLESQIMALEGANMNALTFNAMRTGAQAMKDARGNLDADDVEDVMDDIKEEMDTAEQIGEAIARPAGDLFDDDELMEELNKLEGAELEEKLLEPPAIPTARPASPEAATVSETKVPDLPSVPTATPSMLVEPVSAEEDEEERALRELEASMAT